MAKQDRARQGNPSRDTGEESTEEARLVKKIRWQATNHMAKHSLKKYRLI